MRETYLNKTQFLLVFYTRMGNSAISFLLNIKNSTIMQEKEKVAFLLSFQTLSISLNRVKHNSKYVYLLMRRHEWIDYVFSHFYEVIITTYRGSKHRTPTRMTPMGFPWGWSTRTSCSRSRSRRCRWRSRRCWSGRQWKATKLKKIIKKTNIHFW